MSNDLLFFGQTIFDFMQRRQHSMESEISSLSREQFGDAGLNGMANAFVQKYMPDIPVLHPDQRRGEQENIDIDISHDPTRMFYHTGIGSPRVNGTRFNIRVPFDGDAEIFRVRPSTYTTNPPRGRVIGRDLLCQIDQIQVNGEAAASEFNGWVQNVNQYLAWHQEKAEEHQGQLYNAAIQALQKRQAKVTAEQSALAALGIESDKRFSAVGVTVAAVSPRIPKTATAKIAVVPTAPEFDCFVSYAGEDRATVTSLVDALTARGVRVWWDKGQIKLGDSLMKKIEEGLSHSRYGLVMVSPYFIAKKWPESELRALHTRAVSSNRKVLLPVLVGMDHERFSKTYPLLADIVTTTFTSDVNALVAEIVDAMGSG